MAVSLISGGDGTSAAAMTTALGSGFTASGGVFVSTSYASASAVSVGGSVGGAAAGCGIYGDLSAFTTSSTHTLYWGMDSASDFTGNGYKAVITFTAAHLRDYITISKIVSGTPTALAPVANAFSDVSAKLIYFKRGKLAAGDTIGIRWVDSDHEVWMIEAASGKGYYMGKVVDTTKTTAGYCGVGLGTDASGTWDNIYTGTFTMNWVKGDGSDAAAGTKAAPYRQIHKGLHNAGAGGITMVRTGTYGYVSNQRSYGSYTLAMPKGTSWYNPQVIKAYNEEVATISVTGTDIEGVGFGITQGSLENAYHYWIDINVDGENNHPGPGWVFVSRCSKIRIQGGETKRHGTAALNAVGVQSTHSNDAKAGHLADYDVHWIDMNVHSQGFTHGMYPTRSGEVVEYCHVHENNYIGIQHQPTPSATVSSATRPIIRYNRIWGHTARTGSAGLFLGKTINAEVYGNLIYDNSAGIFLQGNSLSGTYNGASGTLVYNNVIYNNTFWGIENGYDSGGSTSGTGCVNNKIRNNCIVGNGSGTIRWTALGPQDNGSNGTGNVESNNVTTNPGWQDPTNATRPSADFRLTSGTGIAIDTGYDTTFAVKADLDGFPTGGSVMEIGPYLWAVALTPPEPCYLAAPLSIAVTIDVNQLLTTILGVDPNDTPVADYDITIALMSHGTLQDGT